jgi:2-polyprenyl-3-methyl-5-hydroxy-6-metoxy-1,4-benzoquinol methylase
MGIMAYTGERLPGESDSDFAVDLERHLAPYRWAARTAAGKSVLDVGCGEGYGAAFLAETAASVTGIDRPEPTARARSRYRGSNLTFRTLDIEHLDALEEQFDVVLSCQVIEHVVDPVGFLRTLSARTAPSGGILIVTTPNRLMTVSENPFHLREWTAPELLALAEPVLPGVEVMGMQASERVLAYERERGAQVARILRLDPLGIRKLLPTALVTTAFGILSRVVRRRVRGAGALPAVGSEDFHVSRDALDRALDLVLVAPGRALSA